MGHIIGINRHDESIPAVTGADVEFGNVIIDEAGPSGPYSDAEASGLLLNECPGVPAQKYLSTAHCLAGPDSNAYNPRDTGRKFDPRTSASFYIDLNKLEVCLPETVSVLHHISSHRAVLNIVQKALGAANRKLPAHKKIKVFANNSDGLGASFGSHVNFALNSRCFEDLLKNSLHLSLLLASFLVSGIVYTGAGKVGSENGRPAVRYQLSQRADFFEQFMGLQTTHARPLINTRDESHAGEGIKRLHCIFFDSNLHQYAQFLKVGAIQIFLRMLEQQAAPPTELIWENPLAALHEFSHDPTLKTRCRLVSGRRLSAAEHQLEFFDHIQRFVAAGRADGLVPHADRIVNVLGETLNALLARNVRSLVKKLDWCHKLSIIALALKANKGLPWSAVKALDIFYSSLNPEDGLFLAGEPKIDRLVSEDDVNFFMDSPPPGTRAWLRGEILRRAADEDVEINKIDWGRIELGFQGRSRTVVMNDLLQGKRRCGQAFMNGNLEAALDQLGLFENPAADSGVHQARETAGRKTSCLKH